MFGYDGASTHSVICEKVQDQYKTEREVCDSSYVPPVVGDVPVTNTAGTTRNLTYIGKTTYQRAHAICEAKGMTHIIQLKEYEHMFAYKSKPIFMFFMKF